MKSLDIAWTGQGSFGDVLLWGAFWFSVHLIKLKLNI